jgi:hypothetical protein
MGLVVEGRGQRAEGRGQRAEGRGQRAEGRGQRAEGRRIEGNFCQNRDGETELVLTVPSLALAERLRKMFLHPIAGLTH